MSGSTGPVSTRRPIWPGAARAAREKLLYPAGPPDLDANAGRSARYHSAEMGLQSFFAHDSACTLVSNLNSLYPGTCGGSASCACVGGMSMCNPGCTAWSARLGLFGASAAGEIIAAGYSDADSAFYAWLWEPTSSTSCSFSSANGHRWLILKANSAVGTGYQSGSGPYTRYYTGDFADSNSPIPKIPSGTHFPQQAGSIDFWANWHDSAPPQSAAVNVDGICYPMTLQRGSASNGAYAALGIAGLAWAVITTSSRSTIRRAPKSRTLRPGLTASD